MVGVAWLLCAAAVACATMISARTYECDDLEARLASLESARAALLHEIEIRRCSPSAPSPLLLNLHRILCCVSGVEPRFVCPAGEARSSFLSGPASRELLQGGKQLISPSSRHIVAQAFHAPFPHISEVRLVGSCATIRCGPIVHAALAMAFQNAH